MQQVGLCFGIWNKPSLSRKHSALANAITSHDVQIVVVVEMCIKMLHYVVDMSHCDSDSCCVVVEVGRITVTHQLLLHTYLQTVHTYIHIHKFMYI